MVEKGLRLSLELGLGFKLGILPHINITLYVCYFSFFTTRTMCLV
jgi:hypothetical protein